MSRTWWDMHADAKWSADVGTDQASTRRMLVDEIRSRRHPSCLDVGCGLAVGAEEIGSLGCRYVGVEFTAKFCREVAERGVVIVMALSDRLPFDSRSFALVHCRHVVEHLPELEPTLREMLRVACDRVMIVLGEPPTIHDRPSFDQSRGLHWNRWGIQRYQAVLDAHSRVESWSWQTVYSGQGRCGGAEAVLLVELR